MPLDLLEPNQAAYAEIQRRPKTPLPAVSEEMRMANQRRLAQANLEAAQELNQTGQQALVI